MASDPTPSTIAQLASEACKQVSLATLLVHARLFAAESYGDLQKRRLTQARADAQALSEKDRLFIQRIIAAFAHEYTSPWGNDIWTMLTDWAAELKRKTPKMRGRMGRLYRDQERSVRRGK